jgi:hypothetical protein
MYMGLLKERHIHLKNMLVQGRTTTHALPGLSAVYILLVGHFPYYRSPDLTLIKAS